MACVIGSLKAVIIWNPGDAIFITANIITIGCISYLLYFLSLYRDKRELGDFQIKTWHFTEAASFFIFLIYAPVSSTEYFRESIDQAGIQAQHEAQQPVNRATEAQIRLLTEIRIVEGQNLWEDSQFSGRTQKSTPNRSGREDAPLSLS